MISESEHQSKKNDRLFSPKPIKEKCFRMTISMSRSNSNPEIESKKVFSTCSSMDSTSSIDSLKEGASFSYLEDEM